MVVMSECCRLYDSLMLWGQQGALQSGILIVICIKYFYLFLRCFFFKKFCHHFSDLKIHAFFEGWGSLPRIWGLFSISKLPLSFFSPRSLLLPSYILCWREQSRLIFSIWFEINREDSKGKTNAGGNDGFRLSSSSLCKRINPNLESVLLLCVWSEIVQPLCFTLLRPSALSSGTQLRWDVPVRCCVIPSLSQQWWNTVSHCEHLPAHISITQAHCCS